MLPTRRVVGRRVVAPRRTPSTMKLVRLSLRTRFFATAMVLMTGAADAFANDPVAADALFQAGKQLITDKKYAEACSKYDASYKLDPTLGTLLNLADCYEKAE